MSSARLTRILRSASFRLPLLYAVLFIVSAGVLFATRLLDGDRGDAERHGGRAAHRGLQLAEIHRRSGLARPRRTDHAAHELPHPRADLLSAAGAQPPRRRRQPARHAAGQRRHRLRAASPSAEPTPSAERAAKLTGFGLTLSDGSFLLVAQDANRLVDMQRAIVRAFAWAGGLTLLLAIAGGALLGSNFLRRIDTITRTSRAIMEGDLSARIPVRGTHDEIDQLVASLNAMLDRIQQLMDGLRQVSSDIAHDLRTPLGRLRQQLEDARERATTTADYDAATDAAIEEADGAARDLLGPAAHRPGRGRRAEERLRRPSTSPPCCAASARPTQPSAEDSGHKLLDVQVEDGVTLTGDRQLLAQLVSNLVENALQPHAGRHHGPLGLRRHGDGFEIEVADNGPGHSRRRARQGVRPLLPPRPQPLDLRQRPRPRAGQGDRRPARALDPAGGCKPGLRVVLQTAR